MAKCLELPVTTEGETRAQAIGNIREAVEGYLEVRAEILGKSKTKKQLVEIGEAGFQSSPGVMSSRPLARLVSRSFGNAAVTYTWPKTRRLSPSQDILR